MRGKGTGQAGFNREVFFEFTVIGNQVRVAALDSKTGVEVIIIAPKTAAQSQMQQIAMAKLMKRLRNENLSE